MTEKDKNQTADANTDLTHLVIDAVQDRKGRDITIIDLSGMEGASTGKFIICTGNSTAQVGAIADNIRERLASDARRKPYHYDGYRNCQWIVLDYGEAMIHVFLPDTRKFYDLESLWGDAPSTEIPNLD
ncbi:MAG: ribosome silencing factor [Muribaculaceae bacterium]|nr:ribosome silencing factor [Muribaculaceae bacterium]